MSIRLVLADGVERTEFDAHGTEVHLFTQIAGFPKQHRLGRGILLLSGCGCLFGITDALNFGPFGSGTCEAAAAADIRGRVLKGDAPKKLWKWSKI